MRRHAGALLAAAFVLSFPALAQNDLSTIAIIQPVSGCALTSAESVTIRIFNFAANLPAATTFNVSYAVNAGPPVTELVTLGSTLLSNSTLNYTFTTPVNLSAPGSYTFSATVSLAGDINPTNNAFTGYVVTSTAPSVGGTVGGGTGSCPSVSSGVLTLSGHTGSVVRWEFSTDGGATWVSVANTATTQPFSNVALTTWYRALVQNVPCAPQYSSTASVSPAVSPPVITAPSGVCPGSTGNAASVPDAGPGAQYAWGIANGTVTSGAGTPAIAFTASGAGPVGLTVTVQSAAGCIANGGATIPLKTPGASIQAPASACASDASLTASVQPDQGAGAIYFWTIANGTITGGLGTRTITFRPAGASPVTLEALVFQSGCTQDATAVVPVSLCTSPASFRPVPPCRAADTRLAPGALGGPALQPGETRVFPLAFSSCGLGTGAAAAAVNVTAIPTAAGGLALGAGNASVPAFDVVPLAAGKVRAVQTIVRLAADGTGSIAVRNDSIGPVDVVVDVSGAFE